MVTSTVLQRKDVHFIAAVTFVSFACIAGAVVMYHLAGADPELLKEYRKSAFDKLALGGVLGGAGVLLGWWFDDVKARRTFIFSQQVAACSQLATDACRLADSAGEWLYHEASRGSQWDPKSIYTQSFEREIKSFGSSFSDKYPLLPFNYRRALDGFHTTVLKPYYLCRDRDPEPAAKIGASNLTCAEYMSALKNSVTVEFQRVVGLSSSSPGVDLVSLTRAGSIPLGEQAMAWEAAAEARARADAFSDA